MIAPTPPPPSVALILVILGLPFLLGFLVGWLAKTSRNLSQLIKDIERKFPRDK